MAEAILRHRLQGRGVDARVHSAGLLEDGNGASTHGVDILRDRGMDLSSHSSRRMTMQMINDADLILGMAREHVREAVVTSPPVFPRAYTLKELVRRATLAGPRRADQPLRDWLGLLHVGRTPDSLMSRSNDDDVADPYGLSRDTSVNTADELERLIDTLVSLTWGQAGAATPDGGVA